MPFRLEWTDEAWEQYGNLEETNQAKHRKVKRALGYLQHNPRHPSLNTHKFDSLEGPHGEEMFEAYAENNTPGAMRIFFYYSEVERYVIHVHTIVPHPD